MARTGHSSTDGVCVLDLRQTEAADFGHSCHGEIRYTSCHGSKSARCRSKAHTNGWTTVKVSMLQWQGKCESSYFLITGYQHNHQYHYILQTVQISRFGLLHPVSQCSLKRIERWSGHMCMYIHNHRAQGLCAWHTHTWWSTCIWQWGVKKKKKVYCHFKPAWKSQQFTAVTIGEAERWS